MVVNIGIGSTLDQVGLEQAKIHSRVPSMGALFETIQCAMKLTNEVFSAKSC
jgi:hypothetical protein